MSSILKRKRGYAKSLAFALCENEVGALLANQNAVLQCKINSAKQGVVEYPILAQSPKVYFMCLYDGWSLNPSWTQSTDSYPILQTYKIYDKAIDINATFWHLSQCIFYTHQVLSLMDNCMKYEQNQPIRFWYLNKHINFKTNIAIITHIWHRGKCYFTYISNTWYLITVPNMNLMNPFFSEISQQIDKMYDKLATITQNW